MRAACGLLLGAYVCTVSPDFTYLTGKTCIMIYVWWLMVGYSALEPTHSSKMLVNMLIASLIVLTLSCITT